MLNFNFDLKRTATFLATFLAIVNFIQTPTLFCGAMMANIFVLAWIIFNERN